MNQDPGSPLPVTPLISQPPATPIKPAPPILPIIITFLLTSVLFIGGFYAYQRLSPPSTPIETPQTSPSPTPDPTATWQTYTNSSLNIQFNYPKSWQIRGFAGDQENYHNSNTTYTRFIMEDPDHSLSLSIRNSAFEGAYDQCMIKQPSETQIIDNYIFSKTKLISQCDQSDVIISSYYNPEKQLTLTYNYHQKSQQKSEETINQILSTFKFTE